VVLTEVVQIDAILSGHGMDCVVLAVFVRSLGMVLAIW